MYFVRDTLHIPHLGSISTPNVCWYFHLEFYEHISPLPRPLPVRSSRSLVVVCLGYCPPVIASWIIRRIQIYRASSIFRIKAVHGSGQYPKYTLTSCLEPGSCMLVLGGGVNVRLLPSDVSALSAVLPSFLPLYVKRSN